MSTKADSITKSSANHLESRSLGKQLVGWFWDTFNIALILVVGWFLIGWYTQGNILSTGYQDWIYHAYRIESLESFGVTSWTHVWSNGLNIWRAYPFVIHYITAGVKAVFSLSTTQAMLWVTVFSFISIRVLLYTVLRWSGVDRFSSLLTTILLFGFAQQWITVKDFLAFNALIVIPPFIGLWRLATNKAKYLPLLSAFAGIALSIHIVVGYSLILLWGLAFLMTNKNSSLLLKILSITILIVCMLPFVVPYFGYGYSFSNPIFASPQFLRYTFIQEYFGLSLPFVLVAGLTWFLVVFQTKHYPSWTKILLLFSSLYLFAIVIGPKGYFPSIMNKLQFSRAIPIVALAAAFPIGYTFQAVQHILRSRFFHSILVVVLAIFITESIHTATSWSAQPVVSVSNGVAQFFEQEPSRPTGSVFIANVSEATYFAPRDLRYATSYNEHLEPHPLAQRFRQLLRNEVTYTGVSATQVDIIRDYKDLLGVEYVFIPQVSPLVEALNATSSGEAIFEQATTINSTSDSFSVLRNPSEIVLAYTSQQPAQELFSLHDMPKPTLEASSWAPWDLAVNETLSQLQSESFTPATVSFHAPNRLTINWNAEQQPKTIFVAQSYDRNWSASIPDTQIEPTNLRLMAITLPENTRETSLELTNHWPQWHWPIQFLGLVTFLFVLSATVLYRLYESMYVSQK